MEAHRNQTKTPYDLVGSPKKQALLDEFKGKHIATLRTPAAVIDRALFKRNCTRMHENAKQWGASFRAHVKTHKTAEGVRLQLVSQADKTYAVVVSTLMEAWEIVRAGLVADGTVKDILYGLPVGVNKIEDLSALWDEVEPHGGIVRLLVDHPEQLRHLANFEEKREKPRHWSVFLKVDAGGSRRAGLVPGSSEFQSLLDSLLTSPAVAIYGFYCHAGQSYGSRSFKKAEEFLSMEVEVVNEAAGLALATRSKLGLETMDESYVIAVGSTPTAHAATAETRARMTSVLNGRLELHAGNYALLDLQQLHTGLVERAKVSQRVLATVLSYYPGRGQGGSDEALCDAGAIAMSKDTGPSGSFGEVIGSSWKLGRVSQEHGILTRDSNGPSERGDILQVGQIVHIVGQHACLTLAAYPWYYVVDSEEGNPDVVQDVWVPWKGW